MSGLPELAPVETVMVYGEPVPISGVPVKGFLALCERFPEFGKLFGFGDESTPDLTVARVLTMGDDLLSAIIAAGLGCSGNKTQEERASQLPLETQFDLVEAIFRATMPSGVGPFVERVAAIAAKVTAPSSTNTNNTTPTPGPAVKFPRGANVTRVKASSKHLDA